LNYLWCRKVVFVGLKRKAAELFGTWNPKVIPMEGAASGQAGTHLPIKAIRHDSDPLGSVLTLLKTAPAVPAHKDSSKVDRAAV